MKYSHINSKPEETFLVEDLSGGIDRSEIYKSPENCVFDAENVWHKDGALKTRPSLRCVTGKHLPLGVVSTKKLTVTDTVYFLDGKRYNVAYFSSGDGMSYEHIYIYLVSDRDNVIPIGRIPNYRVDAQTFYSPGSIFFIVGEKTAGVGIYAFVKFVRLGATKYQIYESDGTDDEWTYINSDYAYVPTVLINGRGNRAEEALEAFNLPLGTPTYPEQYNLLNSAFTATFSSDGFSWSFKLPEVHIDSTTVKCTLSLSNGDVEFNIPSNGGDTKTYGDRTITAYCSRSDGRVYFMSEGVAWNIPQTTPYRTNNIIVTAYKSTLDKTDRIVDCKNVAVFNSRAYVYGSDIAPNEIYSCRLSCPLYFPQNAKTALGSPNQKITAAGYQNDKLIVFKEGEMYKVNVTAGSYVSKAIKTLGESESYYLSDALTNDSISTKVGCLNQNSLASDSGQLIWVGSDKKVYTLEATTYGSEKNVFELSERINPILSEEITDSKKVMATAKDGYYYLFVGNKVFVCDCHITNMGYAGRYGAINNKSVSWYRWTFPHETVTTVKYCGEIMAGVVNIAAGYQYFAVLSGAFSDSVATALSEGEFITEERKIPVKVVSCDYGLGRYGKKRIRELEISVTRDAPLDIKLITDKKEYKKHIHNVEENVALNTGLYLPPAEKAAFAVSGSGNIILSGAEFVFKAVK